MDSDLEVRDTLGEGAGDAREEVEARLPCAQRVAEGACVRESDIYLYI